MDKKKLTITLILIIVVVGLRFVNVGQWLNIENVLENKAHLIEMTRTHYLASILIFLGAFVLLGTLGVPVYAVFTLAAGLLFGFIPGLIVSMIASTIGGFASFYISRYALYDYFRKKYSHRVKKAEDRFNKHETLYLLSLRLLPGFPYFITNILAGVSKIKNRSFLIATVIGILPSVTLFTYTGSLFRKLNSFKEVYSFQYLWPIILVVLMTLSAVVIKLKRNKA